MSGARTHHLSLTCLFSQKVETDAMPSRQVFENKDGALYTTSNGAPVAEPYAVEKLGPIGPLLLQGVC